MAAKGDTEFGRDLIESLEQAVAIAYLRSLGVPIPPHNPT